MRLINLGSGVFINANQVVSIDYKLGKDALGEPAEEGGTLDESQASRLEVFLSDGRSMKIRGDQADRLYTTLMGIAF